MAELFSGADMPRNGTRGHGDARLKFHQPDADKRLLEANQPFTSPAAACEGSVFSLVLRKIFY